MAWDWSHTPEAYSNAKLNMMDLCHETLAVIYAEIRAHESEHNDKFSKNKYTEERGEGFSLAVYEPELLLARKMPSHELTEFIWSFMKEYRTCDNGGFNAYCCPGGCHTVSFDRKDEDA